MTAAPSGEKAPASRTLQVSGKPGEDQSTALARTALRPTVRAAVAISGLSRPIFGDLDATALVNELSSQVESVSAGDLKRAEAMLISQAHTLDAIFSDLARRAVLNMGQYLDAADRYMRLAFKAQSQCRATLETLAAIKNPPTIFAKQANVTSGPQQVNNGVPALPRARETEIEQSRLLEARHGERLDGGTEGSTVGADPAMETVGELDGAEDKGR